jgi:hypothetical protein
MSFSGTRSTRRRIAGAAVAAGLVLAGPALAAPAFAGPGGTENCNISPGNVFGTQICHTNVASFSYAISFSVSGAAAGSTYTWTLSGATVTGRSGCGTGDDFCAGNVSAFGADQFVVGAVVVSQGGTNENLSRRIDVPAVCSGPSFC